MIELTAVQVSVALAFIAGIVWLIRLEAKINKEIALREQFTLFISEKDKHHNGRIQGLEGRVLDELRKLREDIGKVSEKLDKKQDKE
jgi:hypothetical protein